MACCSCCSCCSLKALSIPIAFMAIFVFTVNPLLNQLVEFINPSTTDIAGKTLPFDPSVTDVLEYNLTFIKQGHSNELKLGIRFIMQQSFPKWMVALASWYNPPQFGSEESFERHTVDFIDARNEKSVGSFKKTGFTLIDMKDDPSIHNVKAWRSPVDIQQFRDELKPHLQKLFPEAVRFEFTYNVVRGGTQFGDQPAAIDGPHLDYTQNDTARELFHEIHPVQGFTGNEQNMLLGKRDTDELKLKAMLGIWKPIDGAPVCDHPLAVMDARTFYPQHETPNPIEINFGFFLFHNLNGGIHYDEKQKWYYYSFQKKTEVLVFTQYSKGKYFANPHTSFRNPNCPDDLKSRVSVEMRVGVFVKK